MCTILYVPIYPGHSDDLEKRENQQIPGWGRGVEKVESVDPSAAGERETE